MLLFDFTSGFPGGVVGALTRHSGRIIVDMFRLFCLFILFSLRVFGQADVLLSTPSKSFTLPTNQPVWQVIPAPTSPTTMKGSTFQPSLDSSETSSVAPAATDTPLTTETDSTAHQSTNPSTETSDLQTTNATTQTPAPQTTNVTTASLPTPTTPAPPEVGDYVVRASPNSPVCLMAKMGLQFSYRMGAAFHTININPNVTMNNGTCGDASNNSTLVLFSDNVSVQFVFTSQTRKFFLSAVSLIVITGSVPIFTAVNNNLSLWEASLGSSYMCKKEQHFKVTNDLILNTFDLQVQPFGVTQNQFSTAHECSVDDTNLLIPIIVGAALAVLILIVVIAYVIGRRKTYVGYQTL